MTAHDLVVTSPPAGTIGYGESSARMPTKDGNHGTSMERVTLQPSSSSPSRVAICGVVVEIPVYRQKGEPARLPSHHCTEADRKSRSRNSAMIGMQSIPWRSRLILLF